MTKKLEGMLEKMQNTMDERFTKMDKNFAEINQRFEKIEKNIEDLTETVTFIKDNAATKVEMQGIKATMVTKDYLDIKMADMRGDLVILTRKEDTKLNALVGMLQNKKVITKTEANKLAAMEPFPQLAL